MFDLLASTLGTELLYWTWQTTIFSSVAIPAFFLNITIPSRIESGALTSKTQFLCLIFSLFPSNFPLKRGTET